MLRAKDKKIAKDVKSKKEYLSYYQMMSKGSMPSGSTWTQKQYVGSSSEGKQLAKTGMSYKKYKRMGGK